jgi:hypothetical protein
MVEKEATFKLRFVDRGDSRTPVAVNCSLVHMAQGTAFIDFGLVEPETIVKLTNLLRGGEKVPEEIEARLLIRVAMSPQILEQIMQQIKEVLTRTGQLKGEEGK